MKTRTLLIEVAIALAIALIPEVALGWGPYGYGPPPGPPAPPWAPPWALPDGPGAPAPPARLGIERGADQDNYYLTVRVEGIEPQAVTVTAAGGRWLAIGTTDTREQTDTSTAPEGGGWSRSYSYRSGSMSQRLTLPPDADLSALRREDGQDQVRITVPRRR